MVLRCFLTLMERLGVLLNVEWLLLLAHSCCWAHILSRCTALNGRAAHSTSDALGCMASLIEPCYVLVVVV